MSQIEIYSSGLCACSVCAPRDTPVAAVEEEVNALEPTGIKSRWAVSGDKHFRTGESNPCPCNREPGTRVHYLMNC